jgi:hypothetical protein
MLVIEYILIGLVCFALGTNIGNSKHRHVRQPDKQIIIDDSTKVVNIYIDNNGRYWSDPYFSMNYMWSRHYGSRVIVFHKGGKSWKKGFNKKRWNKHLRKKKKWG